jgi:uncharacterized membrane protein
MTFDQEVVVIYMLDDKIKMKQAVDFIVKVAIGVVFLSIFVGIFALFLLVKWI